MENAFECKDLYKMVNRCEKILKLVRDQEHINGECIIIIDKSTQNLVIYKVRERYKKISFIELERYPCSTAKYPGDKKYKGDERTPHNTYSYIISKEPANKWIFEGKLGEYGDYFLRLEFPEKKHLDGSLIKYLGIHGTNQPEKLGKRASHGCIRVDNDVIVHLKELLPVRTKVYIFEKM